MDDGTPRFSSLLSSTLVKAGTPAAAPVPPTDGTEDGGDGGDGDEAPTSGLPAAWAGLGTAPKQPTALKNTDFRAALLPFLAKSSTHDSGAASDKPKGKKKGKRSADDSDDEAEPAPALTLDKSPAEALGVPSGLVLRKTKAAPEKKRKTEKIKF